MCPFDHGSDPVVVEDVNLPNMLSFQPPQIPGVEPPPPPGLPPPPPPPLMNAPPVNLRPPVPPPCALPPSLPPVAGTTIIFTYVFCCFFFSGILFYQKDGLMCKKTPCKKTWHHIFLFLIISTVLVIKCFFYPTQVPLPPFLRYNHQVWMVHPVPLPAVFPPLSPLVFAPRFPRPRCQCLVQVSVVLTDDSINKLLLTQLPC